MTCHVNESASRIQTNCVRDSRVRGNRPRAGAVWPKRTKGPREVVCANHKLYFIGVRKLFVWNGKKRARSLSTVDGWPGRAPLNAWEDNPTPMSLFLLCSIPAKGLILFLHRLTQVLWVFSSESGNWIRTDVTLGMWSDCCVATLSGKNVIFLCEHRQEIQVLNIQDEQFTLFTSEVSCPRGRHFSREHCVSVTGGGNAAEKIVVGWVRKIFVCERFAHLSMPPIYLMRMMSQWVCTERLHVTYKNRHFAIDLKHVLRKKIDKI